MAPTTETAGAGAPPRVPMDIAHHMPDPDEELKLGIIAKPSKACKHKGKRDLRYMVWCPDCRTRLS